MDLKYHLAQLLTPERCLAIYRLKYPFSKGRLPSGATVGYSQFRPTYQQAMYDLVYHDVLLPMGKLPLEDVLAVDLTQLLPPPYAEDYPEICLGMVTILDQTRLLTTGYDFRYTRVFFDPICERLVRQLIALPEELRPDGKQAWTSRGYSVDDWLVRTLWFWAPLVHADEFMTVNRQQLKDWLHSMRSEVESHAGVSDPFAPCEVDDDVDVTAFERIESNGPPLRSYASPEEQATVSDYSFWWIRILNSHFAITDMCGHYPYWIRWTGVEWTEQDGEFMRKTNNYRYDPVADEPVYQQVREDVLNGVWRPMQPTPTYEGHQS